MKRIFVLLLLFCACRTPSIYRFDQRHYDIVEQEGGWVLWWIEDPKVQEPFTRRLWMSQWNNELHFAGVNEHTVFKTKEEAEKAAHRHLKQVVQSWKDNK